MESTSFRIVQEALTNIAKHASATRCDVRLRCVDDTFTLVVEDDGVGFEPGQREPVGSRDHRLGLIGIRERAAALGGTTRVETAPGRGTRLIVEMPRRARPILEDSEDVRRVEAKAVPNLEMTRG